MVDKTRPVGEKLFQLQFSSGQFGTHKIETKVHYISISNLLHLLSATCPVPHAVPILASLVVESKAFQSFLLTVILSLIVVL